MKKNNVFAIIGIIVTLTAALAGVIYFFRRKHIGSDFEDDLMEYIDGDDSCCDGRGGDAEEAPAPAPEAPADAPKAE